MSSPLLTDILAYWKLDTTSWIDSTGNGNTLSDGSTGVTIGTGIIAGCAEFADGQYLSDSQSINASGDWAMSFWLNPSNYDNNNAIISGGANLPNGNLQLYLDTSGVLNGGLSQSGPSFTSSLRVLPLLISKTSLHH